MDKNLLKGIKYTKNEVNYAKSLWKEGILGKKWN